MPKVERINYQDGRLYAWAMICPACECCHQFPVDPISPKHAKWTFNGDVEKPTMIPSIRVYDPESFDATTGTFTRTKCHLNLTDGKIIYHGDSPHRLSGQTIDCPDWDDSKL